MEIRYQVEKIERDYEWTDKDGNSSIKVTAYQLDGDDLDQEVEFGGLPPEIAELVPHR